MCWSYSGKIDFSDPQKSLGLQCRLKACYVAFTLQTFAVLMHCRYQNIPNHRHVATAEYDRNSKAKLH